MIFNLYELVKAKPEYFRQLSCRGLLFTQYDCLQMEKMQDIYSQYNFITYVISGRRSFYQPGYTIDMTTGKCVFAKKGGWLARKDPGEGWCVMVFFIPDDYLRQFIQEHRTSLPVQNTEPRPTPQMITLDVNARTEIFFQSMIPYFVQQPLPPDSLVDLKFKELLFALLLNPANGELLDYLNRTADAVKPRLDEIMEANFMYHLSLTEFAKVSHRSLASFKREFTELYQTSPGRWLLQKRLDYARSLLDTSEKSITEIVFESGFENATHFSRVFKKRFGQSPLQSRNSSIQLN